MINNKTLLSLGLGSIISLACCAAEASKLTIKNSDSDNREISVQVEKGDGSAIGKSDQSVNFKLKGMDSKDIEVTKDIIGGDTFSVYASLSMTPSVNNRCSDLRLDMNYTIEFMKANMGIKCTAMQSN